MKKSTYWLKLKNKNGFNLGNKTKRNTVNRRNLNYFLRFLNYKNGTKSRKASHIKPQITKNLFTMNKYD